MNAAYAKLQLKIPRILRNFNDLVYNSREHRQEPYYMVAKQYYDATVP
jgi:hypothetical protein